MAKSFVQELESIQNNEEQKKEVDKNGFQKLKPSLMIKNKFNNMFFEMRGDENLEEVRTGLHASAVIAPESSFCYREQVLSLVYPMSQGKDLPVNALRIFRAGSDIHAKWQEMFTKCSGKIPGYKLIRVEGRGYYKKWNLLFTPDVIIEIDGTKYIVEIKSMNTYSYKYAVTSSDPHPHARHQIQLYMHLTGIHQGLILIEDKNTQEFEVFKVDYDYREVLPFLERLDKIKEDYDKFMKENIEPERICNKENCKRAQECNMRQACFHMSEMERLK